jgi:hypothetical protein
MPVCAFEAAITGPAPKINGVSGGLVLAKSGTQNNSTACDYVLLTSAEYDQIYHAVLVAPTGSDKGSGSLLDMTPEQAGPVAAAVFGVWAAAWVAKQAIRTLRGSDEKID